MLASTTETVETLLKQKPGETIKTLQNYWNHIETVKILKKNKQTKNY